MIEPYNAAASSPRPRRAKMAAYQRTLLLAVVAGVLAYHATSLPPLDFGDDSHACDGPKGCKPHPLLFEWIIHWAMIGMVLSPIALLYGERHGRNAAAWSLIALAGLPATIWAILLGSFVADASEISLSLVVEAAFFAGVPLTLFGAAICLTAYSLYRGAGQLPGKRISGLVIAGYAYITAEVMLLFGLALAG